jgi:hypothetical protein
VAKKRLNRVQDFLTRLATDPELLLEFINYPDRVLEAHKIREKDRVDVRNLLALEVAKKLLVVPTAAYVHW